MPEYFVTEAQNALVDYAALRARYQTVGANIVSPSLIQARYVNFGGVASGTLRYWLPFTRPDIMLLAIALGGYNVTGPSSITNNPTNNLGGTFTTGVYGGGYGQAYTRMAYQMNPPAGAGIITQTYDATYAANALWLLILQGVRPTSPIAATSLVNGALMPWNVSITTSYAGFIVAINNPSAAGSFGTVPYVSSYPALYNNSNLAIWHVNNNGGSGSFGWTDGNIYTVESALSIYGQP